MKDGTIAETGNHETLMGKKGEYAKLYEIQASAFEHNNTYSSPLTVTKTSVL